MKIIKWEYKLIEIQNTKSLDELGKKITLLGERGWELVSIQNVPFSRYPIIIFKRPSGFMI